MNFEELPAETIGEIGGLKHGSYTIETEVKEALEEAENIRDFKQGVTSRMIALIDEAKGVIASLGTAEKDKVQVVIHVHRGILFNTAVFRDEEKAKKHRDEWIKEQYGELIDPDDQSSSDDVIDLQECKVIV